MIKAFLLAVCLILLFLFLGWLFLQIMNEGV